MELALGILLAVAALAAVFFGLQTGAAKASASKALAEVEALRTRLSAVESEAKKSHDALEEKRKSVGELKEKLKDVKRRRHDEREADKLKKDIQAARAEIEREMERKLAATREEAAVSKDAVRKLTAEIEALKSRRPAPVEQKVEAKVDEKAERPEPQRRELSPEEKARLEKAEQGLAKATKRIEELEVEVKKARGRSETDRRVFVVQKGELELAKDKFRALEGRHNALVLERDELLKALALLDKEMKALRPVAEADTPAAEQKPAEAQAEKPAETKDGEAAA
ncbi:MAG TPA: hypothetical protein DFS52_11915 [Myxococcales bacterium]|nr:hypothetical protein [Myxococcales bacterium]